MRVSPVTVFGDLLLTLGLVVLLFAGYELWGTGVATAQAQQRLDGELEQQWAGEEPAVEDPTVASPGDGDAADPAEPSAPRPPGRPLLRLHVPAFGEGWKRTVLEGTGADELADGPGHYPDTALPGPAGNVAIAGHRVGSGGPFEPAEALRSCAALVLETREAWFVYRVLPMADELAGWDARRAADPRCAAVGPLPEPYTGVVGRQIVRPDQREVIEPVPNRPGVEPTASLLTLTTCHPRFSARERLIVHAMLTERVDKAGGGAPAALTEG